jgi:hypothetical protein
VSAWWLLVAIALVAAAVVACRAQRSLAEEVVRLDVRLTGLSRLRRDAAALRVEGAKPQGTTRR